MRTVGQRLKGFDLNALLQGANLLSLAAAVWAYQVSGANDYVDVYSVFAASLLGLSNVLMLRHERRQKEPFIVIIVAMTVVFYLVRVATLFYVPWSWSLDKVGAGPHEVNQALVFIAFGNLAMFAGFVAAAKGEAAHGPLGPPSQRMPHPGRILLIVIVSIVMTRLATADGVVGRMAGFAATTFLNMFFLIMIAVLYMSMCLRSLRRVYAAALLGLVALFFVNAVLAGSRSAVITVLMFGLITMLSQDTRIRVGTKMLAIGLVVVVTAPFLYFISTYSRNINPGDVDAISVEAVVALEGPTASGVPNRDVLFERMFARAGYLDAATAMIAGRARYEQVIGVRYLVESIIDNSLSPGFDIFDKAKVSLVLGSLDAGAAQVPRRSAMSTEDYNSDLMTAYGESYLLFGYGGLVFLFVGAYAVKRVYLWNRRGRVFEIYIYRSLVIWCFYNWINSYGVDWLLSEVLYAGIFFALFRWYLAQGARSGPVIQIGRGHAKSAALRASTLIPLRHPGSA